VQVQRRGRRCAQRHHLLVGAAHGIGGAQHPDKGATTRLARWLSRRAPHPPDGSSKRREYPKFRSGKTSTD
jgi:hypothetical protein